MRGKSKRKTDPTSYTRGYQAGVKAGKKANGGGTIATTPTAVQVTIPLEQIEVYLQRMFTNWLSGMEGQ